MNNEEIQKWMYENLVAKQGGAELTGQTEKAFNQSVALGYIQPFFEIKGEKRSVVKLYLKSELETYRENKRS